MGCSRGALGVLLSGQLGLPSELIGTVRLLWHARGLSGGGGGGVLAACCDACPTAGPLGGGGMAG